VEGTSGSEEKVIIQGFSQKQNNINGKEKKGKNNEVKRGRVGTLSKHGKRRLCGK